MPWLRDLKYIISKDAAKRIMAEGHGRFCDSISLLLNCNPEKMDRG